MSELRINEILKTLMENTKITGAKLITFFLGEQNEYLTEAQGNKLKNRKLSMSVFRRINILESSDFGKERLFEILKITDGDPVSEEKYTLFLQNARKVYQEYIGESFNGNDVSKMFKQIALLIWFGTPYVENIFDRKSLSDEKYVSWIKKEEEIKTAIKDNKILFVSGTAACGKTRLVEHFINKNVCGEYVFAKISSEKKKLQVQVKYHYGELKEISLEEFLEQCKWKDSKEYLVITWDYYKEKELTPLLQWSMENSVKVIVITRMRTVPEGYKKVLIEKYSEEVLRKIVEKKINDKVSDDDYRLFFELLHYNPFLADVFSEYISQEKETINSFCCNVKREGEAEQLALSKGSKVRCLYRINPKHNDLLSISAVLVRCLSTCSNADIKLLCELIVWTRTPIDKEFVIKMGGFKKNKIDALIDKNYLMYAEDNKIQMYPVFVWVIDALEIELMTINLDEPSMQIKAKLKERKILFNENGVQSGVNLLDSMRENSKCPTAYIEYFYRVIENIICRYQRIYSANTNITDKKKTAYYGQWTRFLEKAIRQVREMGNREMATWIDEKIYYIYKKKDKEDNITDGQVIKRKWGEFILKIMQGTCKGEDWDDIISVAEDKIAYNETHFLIDMFIYFEIYDIALEFIDTANDRYVNPKRKGTIGLLDTYINVLNNCGVNDVMKYLYNVVKYYLKALYEERQYINDARRFLYTFGQLCNRENDSEMIFRAKIYHLFFELLAYWKDYPRDSQTICDNFGVVIEDVYSLLQTKSYSVWTTNSAIVCLNIAFALVPIRLLREDWMNYILELQSGEFDLFQKLADVNKYQYQMNDRDYDELVEIIKKATKDIGKVYGESYTFKKNSKKHKNT